MAFVRLGKSRMTEAVCRRVAAYEVIVGVKVAAGNVKVEARGERASEH